MKYRIILKLEIAVHPIKVMAYDMSEVESHIKYYMDNGYTLIAVQEKVNGEWTTIEAPTL